MPYPKKNLNPDETVALDLHPHWWFFSEAAGALLLSVIAGIAIRVGLDAGNTRKYLGYVALAAIVLSAVWTIGR